MNNNTKIGLEYAPLTFKGNEKQLLKNKIKRIIQDEYPFFNCDDAEYLDLNLDCDKIYKQLLNKKRWKRVYEDDNCLEFVTHPLKYKQSLNTYKEFYKICKKNKIEIFDYKQKEIHYASGGLHINLDEIPYKKLIYLLLDVANRPYLTWCFNDPTDDENAVSLLSERRWGNWATNKKISYYEYYKKCTEENSLEQNEKMFAVSNRANFNHKWIEFRLFDIPQCYEEFKCFIDIAIAIRNRALLSNELPLANKKILKISKTQAWNFTLNFVEKELKIKIPQKVKKIWKMRLDMRYKFAQLKISKLN